MSHAGKLHYSQDSHEYCSRHSLPMAMMASASSGNPYDNYDNREVEQDLIDPDDGTYFCGQKQAS